MVSFFYVTNFIFIYNLDFTITNENVTTTYTRETCD